MTDISALTEELADIYKQKQEVEERLNTRYGSARGRGRGRGGPPGPGMGRGAYDRPPEAARGFDRGPSGSGYDRERPAGHPGSSQDRPGPDGSYGRDRGTDYAHRQPYAEAGSGRDHLPHEQLGSGLSARMQDRLSGMRPSTRAPEPGAAYSNGRHPEERLPRDRYGGAYAADPRDLRPGPPEGSRDLRERIAPPRDRHGDSRGRGREPDDAQDQFAVPKVMSAVVVNGETRMPSQQAEPGRPRPEPGIAKRPRETADSGNPAAAKRNKRMFAGLLGTLQKFKSEDEKFSQSKVAQQRAEALQRAQQQTAENERNAKQAAREAFLRQRREEINKKQELDMLARCKKLEIGLAARIAHHEKLFNFLKTAAGPPVLWMPAYLSAGMQRLLGERKAEFGTWQDEQQAELRTQTDQMAANFKDRVARTGPRPAAPVRKPAEDAAMPDAAGGEGAAEAAPADDAAAAAEAEAMDAEEAAQEAKDQAEQDAADAAEAAELAAAVSPVQPEAQDVDVDDRFATGQPGDDDEAMEGGPDDPRGS